MVWFDLGRLQETTKEWLLASTIAVCISWTLVRTRIYYGHMHMPLE
jgi:hypothetical protein